MGKLISRFRGLENENERNKCNNKISEADERDNSSGPTAIDPTDYSSVHVEDTEENEEPEEGWKEICGIAIDVLHDVMVEKKHKVVLSNQHLLEEEIDIPTVEENRERLKKAYDLWMKYKRKDCLALVPCWEGILERPVMEQSFLVEEYVRKVFCLLGLEDLPECNIPENIPKEQVLVRDPNMPGVFITLAEALEKQKKRRNIDVGDLKREDWSKLPSFKSP